jgi:hypothetical protein
VHIGPTGIEMVPRWLQELRETITRASRRIGSRTDNGDDFERREQAALDIMEVSLRDRFPFALFLRTFHIQFILGNPRYPGDPRGVYTLRDRFAEVLKHGVGALAVAQLGEMPFMESVNASPIPLLALNDDSWESTVDQLIRAASIIVMEVQQVTPGVEREFDMLDRHGKNNETVVVIPDPGMGFELSELQPPLSIFPRVIHISELRMNSPHRSFVFGDLLARTYQIARSSRYERLAAELNGEWYQRFPVTFDGVERGYEQLGRLYVSRGAFGRAAIRCQRALNVATARHDPRAIGDQYVNLAKTAFVAGDHAKFRSFLEQAEHSFTEAGQAFDRSKIESELMLSHIRGVMRR